MKQSEPVKDRAALRWGVAALILTAGGILRCAHLGLEGAWCDEAYTALAIRDSFPEMIANLVDNACKHARSKVILSAAEPSASNRLLSINIDDDGAGLPPEARRVVFNIGERWDTHAPGTGLGLPIVKDLAELYGGEVELGTSSMGGLFVGLRLPRAEL